MKSTNDLKANDLDAYADTKTQPSAEAQIAECEARLGRLRGLRRVLPIVLFTAVVLFFIGAISLGYKAPQSFDLFAIRDWMLELSARPTFAILLATSITTLASFVVTLTLRESAVQAELELLEKKQSLSQRLTPQLLDESSPASYFDKLVKINVDNLAEYYALVKLHTNNSFRASLWAGAVGLVFILTGVIAGFGGANTATPAKLAAVAGIIIEFISAIFFYLYNRTVRQLKEYHDSLLSVQNVLLSLKLVSDTEDMVAKRDMTMQMCKFLLSKITPTSVPEARLVSTATATPRRRKTTPTAAASADDA